MTEHVAASKRRTMLAVVSLSTRPLAYLASLRLAECLPHPSVMLCIIGATFAKR